MILYFNENDPFAAEWLRQLFPLAKIDERSIHNVEAKDVGFERCHFFGGIGGWEYALRLAGWPQGWPVWTGSCPCQPYSDAGKGLGDEDPRNLWPEFRRLIEECRPPTILGEQVASKAGRHWLSGVRADLEALGYAFGAADLCAACVGPHAESRIVRGDQVFYERIVVGAPHIRQRLWWVADSNTNGCRAEGRSLGRSEEHDAEQRGVTGGLANSEAQRHIAAQGHRETSENRPADAHRGADGQLQAGPDGSGAGHADESSEAHVGAWSNFDVIPCRDGKTRRVESGVFPLAHGIPGRVGRLRGYGNAIVPQVAAVFIQAFLETLDR